MAKFLHLPLLLFAAILPAALASAQIDAPPITAPLPGVSSLSLQNAAGVLKYCADNQLASSTGTDAVLSTLPAKPDVKSADYAAGAGGRIMGDGGKEFAIAGAPWYLQTQACDLVLQRAKTFK